MNIVFTSTAYPPSTGGAQFLFHQLALHLIEHHEVKVVSFWNRNRTDWLLGTTINAPTSKSDYQMDGVPVHLLSFTHKEKLSMLPSVLTYYFGMKRASSFIACLIEVNIENYTQKAEIIHNIRIGREPLSLASLHQARKNNIPFILTPVHHPRWKGWRYQVYDQIYREADGVIALTAAEKEYLLRLGIREERIFVTGMGPVLANSADPEKFLREHQISGPVVLFVGQNYRYKGFIQVLDSMRFVWEKVPEANFVFIGPAVGDSEKYYQKFSDRQVHHLGIVSLQEKTDALAACALLCLPSTQESFGGVYTEAWSYKKPVIGCPIPAVKEVISDGVDGVLIEQDPKVIADQIVYLLKNPGKGEEMGLAGWQKVNQNYSWDRLAQKTEDCYKRVLRAK